jgi:putative exporter of polyketide antibiotics
LKVTLTADEPERVSPPTKFLSKLIGLFAILDALCLLTHKQASVEIIEALAHNPAVVFVFGMALLVAGLAIVLAHNVWSDGLLSVLVTLIGWITLVRGLTLLLLPPERLLAWTHIQRLFYPYLVISLVVGAYLTYAGFRPRAPI